METIALGQDGPRVGVIGFGAQLLSILGRPSEEQAVRVLHAAFDAGATLVDTADGLVAFTHVWWHAQGPPKDPFAVDGVELTASRARVLALNPSLIVPGHGPAFVPDPATPR